jgi:hypothetical protein
VNEGPWSTGGCCAERKKEVLNVSIPMQPSLRTDFKAGISIAKIQSAVLLHSSKSLSIVLPPSCMAFYTILVQSSKLASINLL